MPVFSLYLASNNATQNTTSTNCSWQINWDNLFRTLPSEYQKCRVKYHFVSQTYETTTGISTESRTGYLQSNFVSQSQISSNGVAGVILGLLTPEPIVQYSSVVDTTNYRLLKFDVSTLLTKGIEITRPSGVSDFNLKIMTYSSSSPTSSAYDQDYCILLEFDFDEE